MLVLFLRYRYNIPTDIMKNQVKAVLELKEDQLKLVHQMYKDYSSGGTKGSNFNT